MSAPQVFAFDEGRTLTLTPRGLAYADRPADAFGPPAHITLFGDQLVAFAKAVLAQQAGREREVLVEAVNRARYEQQIAGEGFDAAALAYVEARKALLDFDDKASS